MEVAPNQLIMERPHDKEQEQADVPEGGRLSVTCIAKGAKPQAYIYWNSEPELSKVSHTHTYLHTAPCFRSFHFCSIFMLPFFELSVHTDHFLPFLILWSFEIK